ncbi:hypothetical protein DFH28DRAFT_923717 [Melampsora americana]|nr:hypothetical protein DFH28DRAFT_923717 [Melampsora americana]
MALHRKQPDRTATIGIKIYHHSKMSFAAGPRKYRRKAMLGGKGPWSHPKRYHQFYTNKVGRTRHTPVTEVGGISHNRKNQVAQTGANRSRTLSQQRPGTFPGTNRCEGQIPRTIASKEA